MESTYDLLIIFYDGVKEVVHGVSDYGAKGDFKIFYYTKNNYNTFVPAEKVRFFGRRWDNEE